MFYCAKLSLYLSHKKLIGLYAETYATELYKGFLLYWELIDKTYTNKKQKEDNTHVWNSHSLCSLCYWMKNFWFRVIIIIDSGLYSLNYLLHNFWELILNKLLVRLRSYFLYSQTEKFYQLELLISTFYTPNCTELFTDLHWDNNVTIVF